MAYTRIYGVSVFALDRGARNDQMLVEVNDRGGTFSIRFADHTWTAEQAQYASEVLAEAARVLLKEQAMLRKLAAADQAKDVK